MRGKFGIKSKFPRTGGSIRMPFAIYWCTDIANLSSRFDRIQSGDKTSQTSKLLDQCCAGADRAATICVYVVDAVLRSDARTRLNDDACKTRTFKHLDGDLLAAVEACENTPEGALANLNAERHVTRIDLPVVDTDVGQRLPLLLPLQCAAVCQQIHRTYRCMHSRNRRVIRTVLQSSPFLPIKRSSYWFLLYITCSGGASAVKEPGHFEVRKSSSQVR